MERREKEVTVPHQLIMQDRSKVELTGVIDVEQFDEHCVRCRTSLGLLTIQGADIKVFRLDIDGTALSIEGRVESISYTDVRKGGVLSRLFR